MDNTRKYPSYRQWKAWRQLLPAIHLHLCFICQRVLGVYDGLSTKRIIGGKAAAFGGNGTERIAWNRPEDKIKAGCTVKIRTVEKRVVQAEHVITAYGNAYTVPEVVEETFKDKLMTVSTSGIGCDVCRMLAQISDRGYVDVTALVSQMDPADAPVQEQGASKSSKMRELRAPVTLGRDNILRVKEIETVSKTYVKPVVDDTPVVVAVQPKLHRYLAHGESWYSRVQQ